MQISSIYILGGNGEIIAFRNYGEENKIKVVNDFYNEYTKQFKNTDNNNSNNNKNESIYPCIKIKDNLCCYLQFQDLIFLAIINQELPVMYVYSLLYQLVDILKNSFKGEISQDKFKQNFSSLFILLDHFMDNGQVLVQQKFVLEEVSKPNNVIDKIGDIVIGSNKQQEQNILTLDKYAQSQNPVNQNTDGHIQVVKKLELEEQIKFDIVEYYDCIIDKDGNYLSENINGELKVDYRVTNSPEIKIYLQLPTQFDDISFHDCFQSVQQYDLQEKLQRERALSCQPPLGQNSLLFYTIDNAQGRLPFEFIHNLSYENNQQKQKDVVINLKVINKLIRGKQYNVEDFMVKLPLPSMAKVSQTSPSLGQVYENDGALLWRVGVLKEDQGQAKLKIVLSSKDQQIDISEYNYKACVRFMAGGYSMSGTIIEKVNIIRGPENVQKMAKNVSKSGNFEIRLN